MLWQQFQWDCWTIFLQQKRGQLQTEHKCTYEAKDVQTWYFKPYLIFSPHEEHSKIGETDNDDHRWPSWIPNTTRFGHLRVCLRIFIPILFSDVKEVWNDETPTDDLKHKDDDEHDVHEVEVSSYHQKL